jgi:hypothetical protein
VRSVVISGKIFPHVVAVQSALFRSYTERAVEPRCLT